MNSDQSLRQSILNTLAYFDLADYPLTKEELFSFLWQPQAVNYVEFLSVLDNLNLPFKSGYYFLPGREKIIEERQCKLLISEEKLKIARRAAKIIRSAPFLKAVFVCNTAGSGQAGEDSDIDFFIVAEKNRIWITRLLVTFLLELFHLRRVGKRIKNKICLSFYVTTENLDLAKLRVADDDIHFAYWLNQMLPIFDPDNYYLKFLQANSWTKTYLPNINLSSKVYGCHPEHGEGSLSDCHIPLSKREREGVVPIVNRGSSTAVGTEAGLVGRLWKKAWEKMWEGSYGDLINNQAKQIQLSKMKRSGKPIDRGEDKGVVINDGVLKFHEKDTRIEYREKWKNKILNFKF